jgi:hypothetical protein
MSTSLIPKIFDTAIDIINSCAAVFNVNWKWWAGGATTSIVVALTTAVRYPQSSINQFMIWCIDIVLLPLPSTPDQYKLGTLASNFLNSIPEQLGSGVVVELLSGIFGMLAIYLVFKLYRSLPFI